MGDHTEAFQVDFDPRVITYERLLAQFWVSHRADRAAYSRQYMAAVFATDDQADAAQRSKPPGARTPVITGARFYLAEDYHQKYHLRHHKPLMRELAALSPQELVDSTVAARLNGYVAGHGSPAMLDRELASYGLSPNAAAVLTALVRDRS
jgi:peptide-methionine (S)-S-oxide reductase